METLKFKTNIKCSGCLAKVTPFLNEAETIKKWEVDIYTPEKILTIEADSMKVEEVIETVKKAGFQIEPIKP